MLGAAINPYRGELLVGSLAVALTVLGELAIPWLFGLAIDRGVVTRDRQWLLGIAALFLLVLAITALMRWLQAYCMGRLASQVTCDLRVALFARTQRLSLRAHDQMGAGQLLSRLQNDVPALEELLSSGLASVLSDSLLLVGVVVAMLALNAALALISCAVLLFVGGMIVVWRRRVQQSFHATRATFGQVTSLLAETLAGRVVVQAFVREEMAEARFNQVNHAYLSASARALRLTALLFPVIEILSAVAIASVLFAGGLLIGTGHGLTIGVLIAFLGYVQRFFQPVMTLADRYGAMQLALAASDRISELFDVEVDGQVDGGAQHLKLVRGEIAIEHIYFGYRNIPVLQDLSLVVHPGQHVGLVGPSGAGKSTLVHLLLRFYDVWDGQIRLDGVDLRKLRPDTLRRQFSMVAQEPFLFSGSVLDNIRFSRVEASEAEVREAAELVGADNFIAALPEGYQTDLRDCGERLSAGQRQLLALARAVLADRPIVILDEATSTVDPETEQRLRQMLTTVFRSRTCLIVAHRLTTIRDADVIVVLDRGRIVERGTHNDLLALHGLYWRLYSMQTAK